MSLLRAVRTLFRTQTRNRGFGIFNLRKNQSPEVFLAGHLKTIFDILGINCVLDVGANRGQFATMIRRVGYTGQIVSIEPQTESYAELKRLAQCDSCWRTMNIALGERDGEEALHVFEASDLSSFLSPARNMALNIKNSTLAKTQAVKVNRLDSIFETVTDGLVEPRVFLKLDTQGYDLPVVRGAGNSISNVIGMQSELSVIPLYDGMADYIEALSFYRKLGFEPTGIFPVAYDPQSRHVLEFDAVLTRRTPTGG